MGFKAESSSYAWYMNAAGNMTMVYGFERGIWGEISFVVTTRGNHALVLLGGFGEILPSKSPSVHDV